MAAITESPVACWRFSTSATRSAMMGSTAPGGASRISRGSIAKGSHAAAPAAVSAAVPPAPDAAAASCWSCVAGGERPSGGGSGFVVGPSMMRGGWRLLMSESLSAAAAAGDAAGEERTPPKRGRAAGETSVATTASVQMVAKTVEDMTKTHCSNGQQREDFQAP